MYQIYTEIFPNADEECVYDSLEIAALYDKYPPAVEEYNALKEEGALDDYIENKRMIREINQSE